MIKRLEELMTDDKFVFYKNFSIFHNTSYNNHLVICTF